MVTVCLTIKSSERHCRLRIEFRVSRVRFSERTRAWLTGHGPRVTKALNPCWSAARATRGYRASTPAPSDICKVSNQKDAQRHHRHRMKAHRAALDWSERG